jgi:hypothetical protein
MQFSKSYSHTLEVLNFPGRFDSVLANLSFAGLTWPRFCQYASMNRDGLSW